MRKITRSILIGVGVIIAVPVLAVATTFTVNIVATSMEAGRIVPYGQLVPVDGKEMNVVVAGDGEETISATAPTRHAQRRTSRGRCMRRSSTSVSTGSS